MYLGTPPAQHWAARQAGAHNLPAKLQLQTLPLHFRPKRLLFWDVVYASFWQIVWKLLWQDTSWWELGRIRCSVIIESLDWWCIGFDTKRCSLQPLAVLMLQLKICSKSSTLVSGSVAIYLLQQLPVFFLDREMFYYYYHYYCNFFFSFSTEKCFYYL